VKELYKGFVRFLPKIGRITHPNKGRRLVLGIHKIIGMQDTNHVLEFLGPIFSRCTIPVRRNEYDEPRY
jgi:hypothetical protein